jgi:hypothetical protein
MPLTETEYLLTMLAEQCADVGRQCSRATLFGLAEIQPGQPKTNAERLTAELVDLLTVVEMLHCELIEKTYGGDARALAALVPEPRELLRRMDAEFDDRGHRADRLMAESRRLGTLEPPPVEEPINPGELE